MNVDKVREFLEYVSSDEYYYNPDNIEDFSTDLGVAIRDSFKYLVSCVVDGANEEDAAKLTPELLEALESLKENCEEFIKSFYFETAKLEVFREIEKEGKVEEIRNDMQEYARFLAKVAHRAAEKDGKI